MIREMKIKGLHIATIAILSVLLGGVWLYAQQSMPPVKWTPKELIEIVQPNTTNTVNVSFRANKNLNNVTFFLAPAIKNVVSINPLSFTGISANKDYTIAITIKSGLTSQVKYEGTVQLKDSMNYATNAAPLPVTIIVSNESVPPDPGEAGKQTLEGIDSDNDGVRDDIQRWIVLNYYSSQKAQLALRQYAKSLQPFLRDAEDKQLSRVNTKDVDDADDCVEYTLGLDVSFKIIDELVAQFLNTELRSKTYIKADSQLSGMSFAATSESQRRSKCSFNPDTLEN